MKLSPKLGSSHVAYMMRMAAGLACVGIRGADIEIVRQFLSKRSFRELVILRLIVVAVGGNTLAKKINGKQEPNKTAVETRESLQSLVRHVKTLAPNAIIITLDLLSLNETIPVFCL